MPPLMNSGICRGRDDLEGIRLLLVEAGAEEEISDDIGMLDDRAQRFMLSLPVVVAAPEARLARTRSLDPGVWWVAPVEAGGPEDGSA
jgi:hypothetical protein